MEGNYRKRDALRDAVLDVLKEFSAECMTTRNIAAFICALSACTSSPGGVRPPAE